jgi:hypothetical protein
MDPAVAALDFAKAGAIIANMIESYLGAGASPFNAEKTPVEPMCPCLSGHIDAAPAYLNNEGFERFGAHSRSFGTCCPTLRVSHYHSRARLASGWLARLYREGVEPSGSLRKVSGHMAILLSCSPDAMRSALVSPVTGSTALRPP